MNAYRSDAVSNLDLLTYRRREAADEPAGALVLVHGRGADENDLYPLLDALDPERRLLGVTPRGPLRLPPGGAHWYVLGGLGTTGPRHVHAHVRADDALARRARGGDGHPAGADRPRRLLAGNSADLCAGARARTAASRRADRAERLRPTVEGPRPRPGPAAAAGRDRARHARPGDRHRMGPAGEGAPGAGRRGRALPRVSAAAHDRPGVRRSACAMAPGPGCRCISARTSPPPAAWTRPSAAPRRWAPRPCSSSPRAHGCGSRPTTPGDVRAVQGGSCRARHSRRWRRGARALPLQPRRTRRRDLREVARGAAQHDGGRERDRGRRRHLSRRLTPRRRNGRRHPARRPRSRGGARADRRPYLAADGELRGRRRDDRPLDRRGS